MYWVIEAVYQLLSAAIKETDATLTGVKRVFWGDPLQIPEASQPALIVHPINTRYVKRGSMTDQKAHSIEIRLVDNIRSYMVTDKETGSQVPSVQKFIERMEMTDVNGKTLASTIAGIIQSHQPLMYTDSEGVQRKAALSTLVSTINYVYNTSRNFPTFEAILTFDAIVQGDRA